MNLFNLEVVSPIHVQGGTGECVPRNTITGMEWDGKTIFDSKA